MAIIIHGIDMPKKRYIKGYYITDDGKVLDISRKNVVGKAVQIPPGARLIDADALLEESEWIGERATYDNPMPKGEEMVSVENILNAPTFIEAEVEE